LRRNGGAVK